MKLLVVGANSEYAIERFYLKYWQEYRKDITIDFFQAQNIFYNFYNQNFLNKIVFKLGISSIYNQINKQLLEKIKKFKPDVIFVFKGMEIFPQTLQFAKEQNIKLLNYNPDNPFIFSGSGSGNKNITESIGIYDVHFTYNMEIKYQIESQYSIPTYILPFGFDVSEELFAKCTETLEINKVCFIGNPDKVRALLITKLAKAGVLIDVYGYNWEKFINHKNISYYKTIYGVEFWQNIRRYRVQLNIMRPHNLNSHNMRSFEIPGIGGIQLAPHTSEHELFFEPNKEIFLYQSVEDCVKKINHLIQLSVQEANELRLAARLACIEKKYSYAERAKQVLEVLEDM